MVSTPTVVNGAAALFANTWPATDTIVRPQALGAATILQVRSAQAPTSFTWEVGLGPGQQLEQLTNGSVAVINAPFGSTPEAPGEAHSESEDAEEASASESSAEEEEPLASLPPAPQTSTPSAQPAPGLLQPQETQTEYTAATGSVSASEQQTDGATLMVISPPTATDANGNSVPTTLSVAGDTITASITLVPGAVFPVIAALDVSAPSDRASVASAPKLVYGLSDQRAETFGPSFDPRLLEGPLHVAVARLVIPYDAALESTEKKEKEEKKTTQNELLVKWLQAVAEVKNSKGEELLKPYITLWSKPCLLGEEACEAPPIKQYRKAVKALIKRYMRAAGGLPAVTMWGAWNEPNGGKTPLHSATAAKLWQVAHTVMVNLHCGCTMVAGEFAGFESGYVSRYKKFMIKHSLRPHVWGMHDYHDLVQVEPPLESYKNRDAEEFAKLTSKRLRPKPRIWLSEQGVELKSTEGLTPLYGDSGLQHLAAEDFLRLADTSSRTELVDYYQYGAPGPVTGHPHPEEELTFAFDSALKNEKGEPRPAYCVLAFENHECPKPPTVITGPVHPLTKNCLGEGNTLELTGEINPNGLPTTYQFEYAEEGEKFLKTPIESAGSGTKPIKVSATVSVKDPVLECWSITYRLVGVNTGGSSFGETLSAGESI